MRWVRRAAKQPRHFVWVVLNQEADRGPCRDPGLALGVDRTLPQVQRNFLYMPWMHSESKRIHEIAEPLFKARASAETHDFELRHKVIIDRFDRYPHRNAILGRQSTAQELAFLQQPGSSF